MRVKFSTFHKCMPHRVWCHSLEVFYPLKWNIPVRKGHVFSYWWRNLIHVITQSNGTWKMCSHNVITHSKTTPVFWHWHRGYVHAPLFTFAYVSKYNRLLHIYMTTNYEAFWCATNSLIYLYFFPFVENPLKLIGQMSGNDFEGSVVR